MQASVPLILVALLVCSVEARAEQPSVFGGLRIAPQGAARLSQNPGKSNPYTQLFGPTSRPPSASQLPSSGPATERPIVKCGMRVIPADPRVDPGIVVRTDKNTVKWHVRGIEPSTCW